METRFISDLHFGHSNILAFDNRPFIDVEEHDEELIKRWNNVVNIDDETWILGDVSWLNVTNTINILNQLNGKKRLIIGNHDKVFLKNPDFRKCFIDIDNYKEIQLDGNKLVLCHYPIVTFNGHFSGAYHFFGHVHSTFEDNIIEYNKRIMTDLYQKPLNMYNVGAMKTYIDYTPRTFEEILAENKNYSAKTIIS